MIQGIRVDPQGRCAHYASGVNVVAYRFGCCDGWWACHRCHDEQADHVARPWPRSRFAEASVQCGACGSTFPVPRYRDADDRCPSCGQDWNPDCRAHWRLYFETDG